jgi:preprotein translocase subunit SecB
MHEPRTKSPHISINAQYVKDFSFESPSAPGSLVSLDKTPPKIDLSLDIKISKLAINQYEVELLIESEAKMNETILFIVDLKYAGIFTFIDLEEDQHHFLLAAHCPSMLFPFARRMISNVTQDGGFQPLMIDPIDFAALYHKKLLEEKNK